MRRLLTVICTLLLSASVSGQQIKSRPVGFDDFRSLLEAAGYEAFGFDLSELLEGPGRYDMTVYIKEYESGVEIRSRGAEQTARKRFPREGARRNPARRDGRSAGGHLHAGQKTDDWILSFGDGFDGDAEFQYPGDAGGQSAAQTPQRDFVERLYAYQVLHPSVRDRLVRGRKVHSAGLRCGSMRSTICSVSAARTRSRPTCRAKLSATFPTSMS